VAARVGSEVLAFPDRCASVHTHLRFRPNLKDQGQSLSQIFGPPISKPKAHRAGRKETRRVALARRRRVSKSGYDIERDHKNVGKFSFSCPLLCLGFRALVY